MCIQKLYWGLPMKLIIYLCEMVKLFYPLFG